MVSRLSKPQWKFWCLFSWNPKVLKCFDSILVAKFLEIIIRSMVEENLEHKGAFVLCTLFLVYVILCCIWKKEVSTFKYFPLYDTILEEVNSFLDMCTSAVICLGKWKVQFWGGSSHAYAFFFLLCFNSSEIQNLARKKGKHAFCQAAIRPVFSLLSY